VGAIPFAVRIRRVSSRPSTAFSTVDDDPEKIRVAHDVEDPRLDVLVVQRRKIDELEGDVLEAHHPGGRLARGEGVVGDGRQRVRERRDQGRLAGVGRPDERDLTGPLARDQMRVRRLSGLARRLFLELREPRLEIALESVGPLVLRNDAQHLF
jgi:hypothetical protein